MDNLTLTPEQQAQDPAAGFGGREDVLTKKRKRGRPTNADIIAQAQAKAAEQARPAAPMAPILPAPLCRPIAGAMFDLKAWIFKNDGWRLDDSEKDALMEPLANALNLYLPEVAKRNPEIATLLIVYLITIVKKAGDARTYAAKKKQAEAEKIVENTPAQKEVVIPVPETKIDISKIPAGMSPIEFMLKQRSNSLL